MLKPKQFRKEVRKIGACRIVTVALREITSAMPDHLEILSEEQEKEAKAQTKRCACANCASRETYARIQMKALREIMRVLTSAAEEAEPIIANAERAIRDKNPHGGN